MKLLKVEVTNYCTGKCVYCSWPPHGRQIQHMKYADVIDLIDQAVAMGATEFQPQFFGEPTHHPDLRLICAYAKLKGMIVRFYTNGSKDVGCINADEVTFSVDYDTPELCHQIRPGMDFEEVLDNVHRCVGTVPTVKARITECVENKAHIDRIRQFWLDQGVDKVCVRPESPVVRGEIDYEIKPQFSCPLPREQAVIAANGDMVMCCCDWNGAFVAGNVLKEGLKTVWNSQDMEDYREYAGMYQLCERCFMRRK
jgi:radical SAM protein with 4Fe4S-binding SPASM domain